MKGHKNVQRIRNRGRSLKAIVNIVFVELRLVTILVQVLRYGGAPRARLARAWAEPHS